MIMKKKVMITQPWPTSFVTEFDELVKLLEKNDFEVIVDPCQLSLKESDVIERAPGLYAHICGSDAWTAKAMEYADQLKVISRIGVGYDTVDVPEATKRGIVVATTPGAGASFVAEQAMAMMLAIGRQLLQCNDEVKSGHWERVIGYSLFDKTLGILGLGNIGKWLVKLSSAFDMKVIVYDPKPDEAYAKEHGVKLVSKEELLRTSDFISLHLPKNKDTLKLISHNEFNMMKPSAIIVNCARGGIIDEEALYEALKNKRIFGAGLDVFEKEPTPDDYPLLKLDNILTAPHNAGTSYEGKNAVVRGAVQNVIDIAAGKKPAGVLNPEVLK